MSNDNKLARELENFRRELRAAQRGAESLQLYPETKSRAVKAGKLLRHLEDWTTTEINEARGRARVANFYALHGRTA